MSNTQQGEIHDVWPTIKDLWHARKQENNEGEKNRSIGTDSELTQVLELIEKDTKTVIITELNTFKILKGDREDIKRRPKSNF